MAIRAATATKALLLLLLLLSTLQLLLHEFALLRKVGDFGRHVLVEEVAHLLVFDGHGIRRRAHLCW